MPRKPVDYSKTIIYQICCLDTSITDIYIGQTTDFINRKYGHKTACNNPNDPHYNYRLYQFIRNNGGWDNWKMVQIEEFPCKNKREVESRETYLMKELKSSLNTNQSFTTKEQWNEYHKKYNQTDKVKEYYKKYNRTDERKQRNNKQRQKKALYLAELRCYNV